MATTVIGLSGKKRSGKDTFAEVLVERHGFTRVAFADPVRQAALALDPLIPVGPQPGSYMRLRELVDLKGWESAKENNEVRRLLERTGSEAGRDVHGKNVWVDIAMAAVAEIDGPVVITDVRFRNEAEAVVRSAGAVVRIERPDLPEQVNPHSSETELDDFEGFAFIVYNEELDDFRAIADFIGEMATLSLEASVPA